MIIFSDKINEFQILDYSPTHNQLLIRSLKNKNKNYNIDIILKGVLGLVIPTLFNGLEISVSKLSNAEKYLIDDYGFEETKDYRMFCLKNAQGRVFFINAMCLGVYHNKLDILETSIGRYDMEDFGENILWYAD
jgi:hypothetical protein